GKPVGRHTRAFDDRLVVAGEKTVAVAQFGDAQRAEIFLEEFARAILFEWNSRNRADADGTQRVRDRGGFGRRLTPTVQRAAAFQERRKGGGVVVGRPAVEASPLDRLVLRIREFDRFARRASAGSRESGKQQYSADGQPRSTKRRHAHYCPAS